MNFNDLDFLVYSSHKTSTQSLVHIINNHTLKSIHCHLINNFEHTLPKYKGIISNETFIQGLQNYKNTNNKKLKIISIVRNPKDRLISSFFQRYHSDEHHFLKQNEKNTTVSLNGEAKLLEMYKNLINTQGLSGGKESLDEMSEIFNINIIEQLEKKENYYFFNHSLFELYVLDFNKITQSNNVSYINSILKTNFFKETPFNLSKNKTYYKKYINVKKMIGTDVNNIIEKQYDPFYFNAF